MCDLSINWIVGMWDWEMMVGGWLDGSMVSTSTSAFTSALHSSNDQGGSSSPSIICWSAAFNMLCNNGRIDQCDLVRIMGCKVGLRMHMQCCVTVQSSVIENCHRLIDWFLLSQIDVIWMNMT